MKKIILFSILLIATALSAQTKVDTITWQDLRKGISAFIPPGFGNFLEVQLNDSMIQQKAICPNCPFEVRPASLTYGFKLKKEDIFYKNALLNTHLSFVFVPSWFILSKTNIRVNYFVKPACDTITQIVFQEIVNNIHNQTEGVIDKPVYLGDIFDRFRKDDDLKKWLAVIGKQPQSKVTCPKIFELLKFIKDFQQSGFKTREYELAPELKSYLDATVDGLKQYLKNYKTEFVEIDLECTGYADPDNVSNRIDYKPSGNDKIYYDKKECGLNTATQIRRIALKETNLKGLVEVTQVQGINNNCELSVVRAYVALKYMQRQLNQDFSHVKINYFYAAGGIAKAISKEKSRKIDVKMVFKGAKQK
jgi:hypothetical protein